MSEGGEIKPSKINKILGSIQNWTTRATASTDDAGAGFIRNILHLAVFVVLIGAFYLYGKFVFQTGNDSHWAAVEFTHFPVAVGVPAAAFAALVICTVFRTVEGKIKFALGGLNFEGASGPIIMWILCFLAIATSIRVLWPITLIEGPSPPPVHGQSRVR